jgi:hypothetical protein
MNQEIEKLKKLLAHWIEHNGSHAQNYREWAAKAEEANRSNVAIELKQVAELTNKITGHFERAKELLLEGK